MRPGTELAEFAAGFVVAEGCFSTAGTRGFVFEVGLGATDAATCEVLRAVLGCGRIFRSPRRRAHYDDEVVLNVRPLRELIEVVVPFMDHFLPASHKREQYLAWRARLLDYWEHRAKRVRPCTIDGCDEPRRAHGLCRRHLYAVRGV